jgi:hypothetical protein
MSRNTYRILVRKLLGKWSFGRQGMRWKDIIKLDLGGNRLREREVDGSFSRSFCYW